MTPRIRKTIYGIAAAVALVYVLAYLTLAVVSPEHAARLLSAPAALLPVVAALVQSVIAFSHTTTSTPSGMPPGDEPVAPVDAAARLGLDDHQI
jgi:hypothetical protein